MNEALLEAIWENEGFQERGIDIDEFKKDMAESEELRRSVFANSGFQEKGLTYKEFMADLNATPPKAETNFFDLGSINNTWLGDWIDDMGRAISRGNRSGDSINETISVMLSRSNVTPENLQEFIEVTKNAQELGSSDEMEEFMDAGGFSSWKGFKTFFKNSVTIIPELIVESASGLIGNTVTGSIVGTGAATSAATGGATAIFAMPAAMGMASGVLETTSKYGELLQKEVADRGLEFDEDGVRAVLEDEDAMRRIQGKALARGITIGMLDGLTGGVSASIGAKAVGKGLSKSQKLGRVGGAFAVETAGGAGGEFAAQIVAGEALDITSIGLEAFAEIGSGAPNVLTPIIKDSFRQSNGQNKPTGEGEGSGLLRVNPSDTDASYVINGETVTRDEMESVINEHSEGIANGEIDARVTNDAELSDKLKEAYNAVRKDNQEQGTENVDSPNIQGDTDGNAETNQDPAEEGSFGPGELDGVNDDVSGDQDSQDSNQTQIDDEVTGDQNQIGEDGSTDQNTTESTETEETQTQPLEEETQDGDGLDNQNLDDNEKDETSQEQSGEGEPVQRSGENLQTTDSDLSQRSDDGSENSNVDDDGGENSDGREEIITDPIAQESQAEVAQETAGLRPDEPTGDTAADTATSQSAYTFDQVKKAATRVQDLIDKGRKADDAMNEVKNDFITDRVDEVEFKTAVEAQRLSDQEKRNMELSTDKPYFNFPADKWGRITRFFKKGLTSTGAMTAEQFSALEKKRGYIQAVVDRTKTLNKRLDKLTKGFSALDKIAVDKMLKGASPDALSAAVSPLVKTQISAITKEARDRIDGLTRELSELGLFNKPFQETLRNNEGKYVHRIYMRNIDKSWPDKVSARVWENAKVIYRKELISALKDGRVKKGQRVRLKPVERAKALNDQGTAITDLLSDDKKMDAFMRQILTGDQGGIFKTGGIEGSKDTSIVKKRKDIPAPIREFYGEILDAQTNNLATVTKMASFIANTRLLRDLKAMGLEDGFMSNVPKTDADGRQWVEVNKSDTLGLAPLDSPTYVAPDIADFLQLRLKDTPKWLRVTLTVNGLVKAGKTVYSPVTQLRNFVSAGFWMAANGNWNPANFEEARQIIVNARKISQMGDKKDKLSRLLKNSPTAVLYKTAGGRSVTVEEASKKWNRLIELQVADQSVVNRELNDFFKGVSGTTFEKVWANKVPKVLKNLAEKPKQFYSDVDDFYRISYYVNQEKMFSDALYGKPFEQLTKEQQTHVEESAAQVVRDTYPNYSKIYPLVEKLRQFPFLGAFVSFSAEMVRTTRNQMTQAITELRSGNRKLQINGFKRMVGMGSVAGLTAAGTLPWMEDDSVTEEIKRDAMAYTPPWVEDMIIINTGLGGREGLDGNFTYVNPATINPYVYFSDIVHAGENAGGLLTRDGAAKALVKTLEPFLGPEISVSVIYKAAANVLSDDNPETRLVKTANFINEVKKGLQPGIFYTAGRIISPKVKRDDLLERPTLKEDKRRNEIITLATGLRRSELSVSKSFLFAVGPKLLSIKARAKKRFSKVWYEHTDAETRKSKEHSPEDKAIIDAQYDESLQIYHDFLDKSRENASRMRRLGVSESRIADLHVGPSGKARYSKTTTFNSGETSYILGKTDKYPDLVFQNYNEDTAGSITVRSTRKRKRRGSR